MWTYKLNWKILSQFILRSLPGWNIFRNWRNKRIIHFSKFVTEYFYSAGRSRERMLFEVFYLLLKGSFKIIIFKVKDAFFSQCAQIRKTRFPFQQEAKPFLVCFIIIIVYLQFSCKL